VGDEKKGEEDVRSKKISVRRGGKGGLPDQTIYKGGGDRRRVKENRGGTKRMNDYFGRGRGKVELLSGNIGGSLGEKEIDKAGAGVCIFDNVI